MASIPHLNLSFGGSITDGLMLPSSTNTTMDRSLPATSNSAPPSFLSQPAVAAQNHDRSGRNSADAEDSEMEGADDTAGRSPIPPPPPPPPIGSARSMRLADILHESAADEDFRLMQLPLDGPPLGFGISQDLLPLPPPPPINPIAGDNHDELRDEEHDDSEDSEDEHGDTTDASDPWYPIEEDTSEPCLDELDFIKSKVEHSAKDERYFSQETFFDIDDPQLVPKEHGKIEWIVERFNGTKDDPVKDLIMRSQVERIGGYDWQIKMFPRGNGTDYLSVYVECLSLLDPELEDEDMVDPPLPFLPGPTKLIKRKSIAAQVSVIMYNPVEPRVYEFKSDAHQFHKKSADYGWKYFSHHPRYDFHARQHGQRQAILRNDKLSFTAYIRIVEDPTGCMWEHADHGDWNSEAITGLRSFPISSKSSMLLLLLHYRPFRELVYNLGDRRSTHAGIKSMCDWLYKMLSRTRSSRPSSSRHRVVDSPASKIDVVEHLMKLCSLLSRELGPVPNFPFEELTPKRLSIDGCTSVQAAADRCVKLSDSSTDKLLIIELERQTFDHEKRSWRRIASKVSIEDVISVNKATYVLHGFVTHKGHLQSGLYSPYIQHSGRWYSYEDGCVTCMTRKQAVEKHEGVTEGKPSKSDSTDFHHADPEVAYILMYVREDHQAIERAPEVIPSWLSERGSRTPEKDRKPSSLPKTSSSRREHLEVLLGQGRSLDSLSFDELTALSEELDRREPAGEDTVMSDGDDESREPRGAGRLSHIQRQILDRLHDNDDFRALASMQFLPSRDLSPSLNSNIEQAPLPGYLLDRLRKSHDEQPLEESVASLAAAGETDCVKADDGEATDAPQVHEITAETTVDYFSREFYKGQVIYKSASTSASPDAAVEPPQYHGNGHLITLSGDEYKGTFSRGQYSGHGTILYKNGDAYTGAWQAGQHHGHGRLTEARSGNVYEGNFENGDQSGEGITHWKQSEKDESRCQICYSAPLNTAFNDCGHVVTCQECARRVELCPVCRKRVIGTLRLWYVA